MRIDDENESRMEVKHLEAQIEREAIVRNAKARFEQMDPIMRDLT